MDLKVNITLKVPQTEEEIAGINTLSKEELSGRMSFIRENVIEVLEDEIVDDSSHILNVDVSISEED